LQCQQLRLPCAIQRFAQFLQHLFGVVEAHAVFGNDQVLPTQMSPLVQLNGLAQKLFVDGLAILLRLLG